MARVINETKETISSTRSTRYHRGTDVPINVGRPFAVLGSMSIRKRVPSGGKAIPEREKPFQNTSVVVIIPSGEMRRRGDDGVDYGISGVIGTSRCCKSSASSGGLYWTGDLEWPLRRDYSDPVLYTGGYSDIKSNVDLLSQAEVKALNGLRSRAGHQNDVDLGLFWAERRETVGMFRDGGVGLLNLARSIAQKDYARSAQVLRDVFGVHTSAKAEARRMARVERWLKRETKRTGKTVKRTLAGVEDAVLGYNLGLSPLVGDLKKAHQSMLTGDLESKTSVKSVARHSSTLHDAMTRTCPTCGVTKITATINRMNGYTVTVKAKPTKSDLSKLARAGLTNPISLAYQSTSLTFILDYWLALGDYLKALDIPAMFEFQEASYTHRVIQNITWLAESHGGRKARGMGTINHTQRYVYNGFPMPIPPLSLKEDALSFKQALNAGLVALKEFRSLLKR